MKAHHVKTSAAWQAWSLRTGLACVWLIAILGSLAMAPAADDVLSASYALQAASQFKAAPAFDCPRITLPSQKGAYETEVEAEEFALLDKSVVEKVARLGGRGSCGYSNPARCGPRNCVAACVTCGYDNCRINGGSCEECKAWMEECKDRCPEHRR